MNFNFFLKSVVTFFYYFVFIGIGFFFSPYLLDKGIDTITIGYLTSLGLALMLLFYFILGLLSDKVSNNKFIILLNLILTIIVFFTLMSSNNLILLSISYILSYITFMVLAPILDGFVLNNLPANNYNIIRACGSLGAAISFFVNTFFLNTTYTNLIIINIIVILLMILILLTFKDNYQRKEKVSIRQAFAHLKYNKTLFYICILTFLTYGTLKADDAYQYKYYTEYAMLLPATVAIVGSLSMFNESLTMTLSRFLQKVNQKNILIFAITCLLIIDFSKFMFYDVEIIVCLGYIFIGLFIGLFVPIAIKTINNLSEIKLKTTSLGIYQISMSLGGVVLGFITTFFLSQNGFLPNIYLLHSIIILMALLFVIFIFNTD